MDTLTHLALSMTGGYFLLKGLNVKGPAYALPLLAVASVLIDVDNIFPRFFPGILGLHSIYVFAALLVPFIAFGLASLYTGKGQALSAYFLALALMIAGHLLFDMVNGQGIPFFYPFSKANYLIPQRGVCLGGGHWTVVREAFSECLIAPMGIAFFAYYGLITALIGFKRIVHKCNFLTR